MNKIFLSKNYIIIDRDGDMAFYSSNLTEYSESVDSFYLRNDSMNTESIPFASVGDWYDEDEITTYTEESLRIFLQKSTTRSTVSGSDVDGISRTILTNNKGGVVSLDFFSEVIFDNIDGYTIGARFGRNSDIDAGSGEDMWNGGSLYTGHPKDYVPSTVLIESSSTNDTLLGDGANTVEISGLQSETSTEYTSEVIELNGTAQVSSINTYWRLNRVSVKTAGVDGEATGDIAVTSSTDNSVVFAVIPGQFNQSTIGAYTVPYGKNMIIKKIRKSITRSTGAQGSATISLRIRPLGGVFNAVRVFEIQTGSSLDIDPLGGIVVSAGSDVKLRIDQVSDNNTIAEGSFEYILINS